MLLLGCQVWTGSDADPQGLQTTACRVTQKRSSTQEKTCKGPQQLAVLCFSMTGFMLKRPPPPLLEQKALLPSHAV